MKKLLLISLCILFSAYAFAQEKNKDSINVRALFKLDDEFVTIKDDNKTEEAGNIAVSSVNADLNSNENNLDSLLTIWNSQQGARDTAWLYLYDDEDVPPADMQDSIYIRRLNNLPSVISLPFNDIIRRHIVYYLQRIPTRLELILGLSEYYSPQFEQVLDLYDIPLEMRALPIIESALNPNAVSRVGATGCWQFMLATGRQYGLTITSLVDERRDPIVSAHAACNFLNDLYRMYEDWTLVLAAYNCGPGNVNKAIKRAGGKRSYWDIYPYLPKETRNYVPAFIAVNYALRYYPEHRLTPSKIDMPLNVDTFMINKMLHFEQISEVLNIPLDKLRELNPQYRRDIIPGVEKPYELRIPLEYTGPFIENEEQIYSYKDSVYFNKNITITPKGVIAANQIKSSSAKPKNQTIYVVKKGDVLGSIATATGNKVADLIYWNNLNKKGSITVGQKLIIKANAAPKKEAVTTAEVKKETVAQNKTTAPAKPTPKPSVKKHTVKSGENLWGIAQKHNVSFDKLLEINGFTKTTKLKIGQVVKLP